jgi:hypothetical protein
MNPTTCFIRTAIGREELQTPKLGLRPRCRQLLFVLDGKLSVDQLRVTMSGIADVEGTLQDMLKLGLICAAGETSASSAVQHTAAPVQQTTAAVDHHDDLADKLDQAMHHSADSGNRFEDAKHHAVDMMIALFGAKSSHVAKLAQAKDKSELLTEVSACKKILSAVASSSKAQSFEQSVMAALQN